MKNLEPLNAFKLFKLLIKYKKKLGYIFETIFIDIIFTFIFIPKLRKKILLLNSDYTKNKTMQNLDGK